MLLTTDAAGRPSAVFGGILNINDPKFEAETMKQKENLAQNHLLVSRINSHFFCHVRSVIHGFIQTEPEFATEMTYPLCGQYVLPRQRGRGCRWRWNGEKNKK